MAWEENSCICLNMQLIAILSRIGVVLLLPGRPQELFLLFIVDIFSFVFREYLAVHLVGRAPVDNYFVVA